MSLLVTTSSAPVVHGELDATRRAPAAVFLADLVSALCIEVFGGIPEIVIENALRVPGHEPALDIEELLLEFDDLGQALVGELAAVYALGINH